MRRTHAVPKRAVQTHSEALSSTERFYEEHADEYFAATASVDMDQVRDEFMREMPASGRILDAGCGSGRDLRVFFQRGYRAVGLDSSRALVKRARAYSGAPCLVGRLEEITFKESFDGVWACASLLHFKKAVVSRVLRKLYKALVPGGLMYASVQQGEGEKLAKDGRFFAYYQPEEFEGAVRSAGFVVARTFVTRDCLSNRPISWVNVIAKRGADRVVAVRPVK